MTTGPDLPRPGAPAEVLRASLESLIAESQALRSDIHGAEQARRRANQINLGVLLVLALFVSMVLVIGWQNNRVISQVRETNNRVADCTTAGGQCFEDGRRRTGGAIDAITRISIYVALCARLYPGESGPAFDAKMEKCVADRLAKAQASPSPGPTVVPSSAPSGG